MLYRGWQFIDHDTNEYYIIDINFDIVRRVYYYIFYICDMITNALKMQMRIYLSRPRIERSLSIS